MAYKISKSCILQIYCSVLFVLSGFIICGADVQTHDVYPETTCQNRSECLTLSDILNERDKYFASDSTLVFYDGDHTLHGEVVSVSNITNFTLKGYSHSGSDLPPPTITCVDSSLSFSDVSIAITSIVFNHCSISLSHAAAVIQDSRFENGSAVDGGALTVLYSSVQFDGANSFVGNMAERYGGAIYATQSSVRFSGTTAFTANMAQHGGAIYCGNDNSLSFIGNSVFMSNTAEYGGAVFAVLNTSLSFNGSSSFMSNTAKNGGAVYAVLNTSLSFNGNSNFMSNTADSDGGAVHTRYSNTLSFNGNSIFMSNTAAVVGGAVSVWDGNTLSFSGNSGFMNNTATEAGSAVYARSSNILSLSGNSSFMSNTADGAVYAWSNNILSFSGSSSFMSNMAEGYGGAVTAYESNTLSFNGSSSFMSNTAGNGGVVYAHISNTLNFNGNSIFMSNTAAVVGGAVSVWDRNTLSFSGNSGFMNNTATEAGSAVYARSSNILSLSGNSSFMRNTADGAVYAWSNNILSFSGSSSFMSNTAGEGYGGAVTAYESNTLSFIGSSSFTSNTAQIFGSAVYAHYSNILNFNGNNSFMSNTASDCGAVYAHNSNTLSFNGNSSFMNNTAAYGGAVCPAGNNTLSFNGNSSFMSNKAGVDGGIVFALLHNTISFNGDSRFVSNTAARSGGVVLSLINNNLSFNGNSSFMSNTAVNGGAVNAQGNILSFNGNSHFKSNMAADDGGAVYVEDSSLNFHGSSIFVSNEAGRGGGIALFSNSHLHLSGTTSLSLNNADLGGGGFVQNSSIHSFASIVVIGNEAIHGGGLFVQASDITLQITGLLAGNTATNPEGGYGGAIFARSSRVDFQGSFHFTNNTALFGGGLAFFGVYDGVVIIKDGTQLTFEGNLAHKRGGAIYVEDDSFTFCTFNNATQNHVDEACFFQTRDGPYICFEDHDKDYQEQANSITLRFDSNTANVSGDIMYGGHLESCVVCSAYDSEDKLYTWGAETFHHYTKSEVDVFSKLSSDPYKVCICDDGHPNCDLREVNHTAYPGQVLVTSMVAVGQMNGIVPSVIRAVSDDLIDAPHYQETQPADNSKQCSQLHYPLFSNMSSTSLKLYSNEPCSTSGFPLTWMINFHPCPLGFTLSKQGACICDERLQKYTKNCNIESLTISRNGDDSFWVGVEDTDELILHPHCPFDYCTEEPAHFILNNSDMQCASGRSGILCGACQPGLGLALGSSRCLSDCSNGFLALLLAFALAGIALVAFLFLCHLTVAEGTPSGLIFYANVLAVNQTVFFPSNEQNLLTVFIAWLNLDLGIETCFFVSLDAYNRTWLQFATPIYIWLMVSVIIVLADRLTTFAKIIGSTNPVAVLATLFLLSYTKLLRAIMAAFSFTTLDYPDGDSKYVWLYDGNVGYLDKHDGRHIALFLFSLLFLLFIFLPYTLLLLCGHWIQKQLWWLSSTKQLYLKFFLDAHYGPYNNQHRYWTGLLLLLRFLMLFVATIININNPQDPYTNLSVILVVSSSLILWGWVVRGFYKKWYNDALEGSFIFNLVVLSGATLQVRQSGGNQAALVYTSVSIAFVTFFGIVVSAVLKQVKEKVAKHRRRAVYHLTNNSPEDEKDSVQPVPAAASTSAATYSVLEIVRNHPDQTSGEIELRPLTSESHDSTS